MEPLESIGLLGFGLAVGVYGTMVGIGGGFVIVPMFLLLYGLTPGVAAGTSLVVVFCNAVSGTIAYARQGRIDYRSGLLFGLCTVPGAFVGAWATLYLNSQVFRIIFGLLLVGVAGTMIARPPAPKSAAGRTDLEQSVEWQSNRKKGLARVNLWLGAALSVVVGFLSSIFGIGGGLIHVPILVRLLRYPPHVAVATSLFILGITALSGSLSHVALGHVQFLLALWLSIGVVVGAQIGAPISRRVRAAWLVRLLAVAMVFVGVRLIIV